MKKGFRILGLLSLFLLLLGVTVVYGYPDFTADGMFPAGKYIIYVTRTLPGWCENWELGWSIPPYTDYTQDYPISLGTGALQKVFGGGSLCTPGAWKRFSSKLVLVTGETYWKDFGLYLHDKNKGHFTAGGLFRTWEVYEVHPHVRITVLEPGRAWQIEWDTWIDEGFDDLEILLEKLP